MVSNYYAQLPLIKFHKVRLNAVRVISIIILGAAKRILLVLSALHMNFIKTQFIYLVIRNNVFCVSRSIFILKPANKDLPRKKYYILIQISKESE